LDGVVIQLKKAVAPPDFGAKQNVRQAPAILDLDGVCTPAKDFINPV